MTRPSTRAKLEAVLAGLRLGVSRTAACDAAGVSRQTFYRELERPRFLARVLRAEGDAVGHLVAQVYRAAPKDWRAAAWLLERRWPESYRLRTEVALGGLDGGPLGVMVGRLAVMGEAELEAEMLELEGILHGAWGEDGPPGLGGLGEPPGEGDPDAGAA